MLLIKSDLYESIKRLKPNTFTSLKEKKNNQSQGKNTQLNQTWKRFQDSVLLQEKHNISSQEVVNYELGPLPLSIACAVWGKVKSNKASLGREMKKIVPIESELP